MYKIIGADQVEYGPVDAGQIRQWIRENRANQQTLVKPEGAAEWIPLGQVTEFALDFGAHAPGTAPTAPGMPPLHPLPPTPSVADLLASSANHPGISVFDCLGRGWRLVFNGENLGLLVGGTLLAMLILMGLEVIPILGALASIIIQGPLIGGLYYLFLKKVRREDTKIGDLFSGFGPSFVQLMVTQVVIGLLSLLSAFVFFIGVLIVVSFPNSFVGAVFGGMVCFIGLLPPVYLSVAWMFALPLVIDKGLDFSEAMSLSRKMAHPHWWSLFGLLVLGSLLAVAGFIGLIVGFFLTLPVFLAAIMCAYEDFFGDSAHRAG